MATFEQQQLALKRRIQLLAAGYLGGVGLLAYGLSVAEIHETPAGLQGDTPDQVVWGALILIVMGVVTAKWWARLFRKVTGFELWLSGTGLIMLMCFSAASSVVSMPIAILILIMRYRDRQADHGAES